LFINHLYLFGVDNLTHSTVQTETIDFLDPVNLLEKEELQGLDLPME
jgi:hypothetical protein